MNDTITQDPKIDAVQRLYAGVFANDVEAILAELADDVDWAAEAASSSVPWYGVCHGVAEVPRFFEALGTTIDITEWEQVACAASDTDVMVVIRWSYTVKATAKTARMYMQHWWRFANGKVALFRGSEDSEQSAAAFS